VSASGNANGDVKEHRDLADSSNEDVIQLYWVAAHQFVISNSQKSFHAPSLSLFHGIE
jgi:predicted alpha/beta-fold hydrolase